VTAATAPWRFERIEGSPDGRLDGPAWDGTALLLSVVDRNEIHRYDPATGSFVRLRHSTSANAGLAIGPDGRLFGAQGASRRVVWYEAGGATYHLEAMLDGRRHGEPRDLVVDAAGPVWFTDDWTSESVVGPVGWPPPEQRSVLRLRCTAATTDGIGDWTLERMTTDTLHPHGIGLAPDGRTLYVTDRGNPPAQAPTLRAYPLEDEGLGDATVLTFELGEVSPAGGDGELALDPRGPRGLAVASDGRLVVAVGPATDGNEPALLVLDPAGVVEARHAVPDAIPTNVAFGGADRATLYVTTDGSGLVAVHDSGLRGPIVAAAD
jgi:gluconolactonase